MTSKSFGIFLTVSFLIFLLFDSRIQLIYCLNPPSTQWTRTYGGPYKEAANSVIRTSDGGYTVVCNTYSFGAGSSDVWLIKTDPDGNMQWNKTYGGTDYDTASLVVQLADGGYILGGDTYSFGAGDCDYWLIRTNANGGVRWNRTYGDVREDEMYDCIQTGDGGYALAGYCRSALIGDEDFWLVKTDADGNMLWNKTYKSDELGTAERAYSVVETSDGGFALVGDIEGLFTSFYDTWLVRTDSTGEILWNRTYSYSDDDIINDMIQTGDGGYAMVGHTGSFGEGRYDWWLVKTNENGTIEWNMTYGGSENDYPNKIIATIDGGFALIGNTNSSGAGNFDLWLVKTDVFGAVQWNKTWGGSSSEAGISMIELGYDEYVLAGSTSSSGAGSADAWLIKTGPLTVGGTYTRVDRLALLAPYIGSSALLATIATVVVYAKKKTKKTSP